MKLLNENFKPMFMPSLEDSENIEHVRNNENYSTRMPFSSFS